VPVPPLSKLRTISGIGAYESTAIQTIGRMLEEGALPWGETCAQSGQPTQDLIQLQVRLDPDDGWRDRIWSWVAVIYLCGLWPILIGILFKPFSDPEPETLILPLRVNRKFHRGLAWWGTQRKRRRLMATVPVYARLLEEYPRCIIRVIRPSASRGSTA
jgi:hypothetical protein